MLVESCMRSFYNKYEKGEAGVGSSFSSRFFFSPFTKGTAESNLTICIQGFKTGSISMAND